jgi:hypothetical protein
MCHWRAHCCYNDDFLVSILAEIINDLFFVLQDNVFVHLICTIQYRVVKENADDAYYELQNPQQQIQSYVFDGKY